MDFSIRKRPLSLRTNAPFRSSCLVATSLFDREELCYEAAQAVSEVLSLSSRAYQSERGLLLRLMNLCGSSLSFSPDRLWGKVAFRIVLHCPKDAAVGRFFPSLESQLLSTFSKIWRKGFREDEISLTLAKGKLLRENRDAANDPSWIALEGLRKNFFPEADFGRLPNGDEERIKTLSFDDLKKALDALRKGRFYLGCVGFEKRAGRIARLFPLAEEEASSFPAFPRLRGPAKDLTLLKEGITSSSVAIAYSLALPEGPKGEAMRRILERLLTDDASPLFLGLREERGLTYGVSAHFPRGCGAMVVSTTFDKGKESAVIQASDTILSRVAKNVDEARLKEVKTSYRSGLYATLDDSLELASFLSGSLVKGLPDTPEGMVELIEGISLGEVKNAFSSIEKVGSFSTVPQEGR